MKEHKRLVVKELKYDGDRMLLYGEDSTYHVIAKPSLEIGIGDTVVYEPGGVNFGWFVSKVPQRAQQLYLG